MQWMTSTADSLRKTEMTKNCQTFTVIKLLQHHFVIMAHFDTKGAKTLFVRIQT